MMTPSFISPSFLSLFHKCMKILEWIALCISTLCLLLCSSMRSFLLKVHVFYCKSHFSGGQFILYFAARVERSGGPIQVRFIFFLLYNHHFKYEIVMFNVEERSFSIEESSFSIEESSFSIEESSFSNQESSLMYKNRAPRSCESARAVRSGNGIVGKKTNNLSWKTVNISWKMQGLR